MEDCYFHLDETDTKMKVFCKKCKVSGSWFWEGSKLGYGPFDFICNKCGQIIHSTPKSKENNET